LNPSRVNGERGRHLLFGPVLHQVPTLSREEERRREKEGGKPRCPASESAFKGGKKEGGEKSSKRVSPSPTVLEKGGKEGKRERMRAQRLGEGRED